MRVFTAAVHYVGEDNEGNFALVARTQERLEAKLLVWFNDYQAEIGDAPMATLEDAYDTWHWAFGTTDLEDE